MREKDQELFLQSGGCMKGKPLLPTLRTKKRYVVYETLSDETVKHSEVVDAIKSSYKEGFGLFGLSEAGLMDTKIFKERRGIIKVNNKQLDKLKVSMALIKNIGKKKLIVRSVRVSGILKKAKSVLGG